jgi:septum formation protein
MNLLVLASGSPYRRSLLERLGLAFVTASPDVDETPRPGETASDLVKRLALLKARAAGGAHPRALVIGSDQCAVQDGAMLGKPGNFEAAFEQLQRSAGRSATFHTGLCLLNMASGEAQTDDIITAVRFRALSRDQIRAYLRREKPYDCAGSFMSERLGIALVERIEGSDPTALVGLPLIRLVGMLTQAGLDPLADGHR